MMKGFILYIILKNLFWIELVSYVPNDWNNFRLLLIGYLFLLTKKVGFWWGVNFFEV